MAYESLYRRYRPQRFADVRGQDDVVRALTNAVREDRVGHAYLLSGPRGTGKTSTARILAKALNCTNLADGEPCGTCESCVSIEAGTSYDLQELDAASNNGVDAMRDLIGKASLGSPGRTKVYILDEVHMLSAGASNALLKTLEEPPGHVVFVLATTDPHKVLPTIRSRTQHFELHLLPATELDALVHEVVADAELGLDDEAIAYALAAGGGSARDTLSALDQVVAAGGVLDRGDQVDDLVDAVARHDTGAALKAMADAVRRGHDPRVVGEALLTRLRDVFLHRMGDPLDHLADTARAKVVEWSEEFTDRACTRALEAVGDALREMRQAPDARIPLEVALVRLTRADTDTSLEGLVQRIERLERGAPAAGATPAPEPATSRAPATRASTPSADPPAADPTAPAAAPPRGDASPSGAGGGRPLDAARALLSDTSRGGRPSGRTPSGGPTTSASAPPPTPPARDRPGTATPEPDATPPADAPAIPPAAETATASASSTSPGAASSGAASASAAGLPTREELTIAWGDHVLGTLGGLTKAMFAVGHFTDASGAKAVFAVPNEVHREKSLQKLPEVEAALTAHFGRPVPIELIVEGAALPPNRTPTGPSERRAPSPAPTSTPTATPAPDPAPADAADDPDETDIGDLRDLVDAPDDDRTTVDRLLETFPGAEIVEP